MVEKVTVSRDEVLYYPWLDHTWIYVHYTKNAVTQTRMFSEIVIALLCHGIKEATGKPYGDMIDGGGYFLIQYDTDEIIDILKNTCQWIMDHVHVKDPTSQTGAFFETHKDQFFAFFSETKKILEEKTYKYFYQSVDGMN